MSGSDGYNFSTEVRVRLSETDAFGIVFHANFYVYFDVARMDYLRNIGALSFISPDNARNSALVHADADFRSPARFDDILVIQARISDLGRSSFTFAFKITHKVENRVVATGNTTLVVLDEKTWKPMPVSTEFRKLIQNFEGDALTEKEAS